MRKRIEPIRPFREPPSADRDLRSLLNLGPKSSAWLADAGIRTIEQVRELGPVGVCRRLFEHGRPVAVLLAYAIEGGLSGTHWNAIPWETKQALRAEFAAMKAEFRKPKRRG
jgi:DNA transformation protein